MVAVGSVPRIPAEQVLSPGHGLQVCASGRQRGSAKRSCDGLLRQHKGTCLVDVHCRTFFTLFFLDTDREGNTQRESLFPNSRSLGDVCNSNSCASLCTLVERRFIFHLSVIVLTRRRGGKKNKKKKTSALNFEQSHDRAYNTWTEKSRTKKKK